MADTRSDAVLLARLQAGDDRALAAVYDQHAGLVLGIARRVTRDDQWARDIVQDVFAYVWEFPARIDLGRGSIRAYLAVVAHRRAVDVVRRSERRHRTESAAAAPEAELGPDAVVVEDAANAWRRERLVAALASLPPEQRAALELAYYEGLTYRDVARTLGIAEGTAKSRLRLALCRLRTLLGEEMRAAIR